MKEYLYELHMHTGEVSPCGKIPAREGIRLYKALGYQGVCITDHFHAGFFESLTVKAWRQKVDAFLEGYRIARDEGQKLGLNIILGMEYCVPQTSDDILIYGFDEEFLYQHEDLYLKDEKALRQIAGEKDLLLIQAHPFRKMISKVYDDLVEGYEVFNGNPRHDSMNSRAESYGAGKGKIMVSGSDFHQLEDGGTGGVFLPGNPKDSRELARLLRSARTPRLVRNDRVRRIMSSAGDSFEILFHHDETGDLKAHG